MVIEFINCATRMDMRRLKCKTNFAQNSILHRYLHLFFFACDPQRIIRNENKQRYGLVFICLLNMIHSPLHQCAVITNIIYIFLHKYRYKTIAFHLSIVNSLFIHSFIYLLYINNIISLFIFHSVCSLPQQLLLTHNTHTQTLTIIHLFMYDTNNQTTTHTFSSKRELL